MSKRQRQTGFYPFYQSWRVESNMIIYALGWAILFIIQVAFVSFRGQRIGESIWPAVWSTLCSARFWLGAVLPAAAGYALLGILSIPLTRWLTKPGQSWIRYRLFITPSCMLYLVGEGIWLIRSLRTGKHLTAFDAYMAVWWVILAGVLLYFWLAKPNPDRIRMIETGDSKPLTDERNQALQGKSAFSALQWLLPILWGGGSLYEIFMYRQWPILSLLELLVILAAWRIAHIFWQKRL